MPFKSKPPGQKWRFSLDKLIPFKRHPCQERIVPKNGTNIDFLAVQKGKKFFTLSTETGELGRLSRFRSENRSDL